MAASLPPGRTIKLLLIGNSGAGKTSLLLSYVESRFQPECESTPTVGVDFRSFRKEVDGLQHKICIWDTAGQERFRSMTTSFYRDAAVIFLVFDVAVRSTFDSLDSWLAEINQKCDSAVLRCLVANKIDIKNDVPDAITTQEALDFAAGNGMSYRQVSAKTMSGVQNLFNDFIEKGLDVPVIDYKDSMALGANNDKDLEQSWCSC